MTAWIPSPGDLVKDTHRGRLGEAVAWDGDARTVSLASLRGGELWEAAAYCAPNELDRMRARVIKAWQR